MVASMTHGGPDAVKPLEAAKAVHRTKQYHNSEEYIKLKNLSDERQIELYRIPPVVGCGVFRHTSSQFWSCRYSSSSTWSTCSWKSGARTPFQCLVKVLKHLIKEHILHAPSDVISWKSQLAALETL